MVSSKMHLGILEDRKLDRVPGTVNILDKQNEEQLQANNSQLKRDTSGPVPIILVPQPSDDPNDPLNWPLWKRDLILLLLSVVAILATTESPLLAANTLTIALDIGRTFTQVALLTGWHLFGVGIAGFFFVASARVWGKRHLFLLGCVLMIVTNVWAGASKKNYYSLVFARIFQGVALAPFEALVNATVGDLFFVHERGKRMAITNLATYGGSFLTPVIVGKMTSVMGWHWPFWWLAIFFGIATPLVYFCIPETAFRRDARFNTDIFADYESSRESTVPSEHSQQGDSDNSLDKLPADVEKSVPAESSSNSNDVARKDLENSSDEPRKSSLKQRLRIFTGRKTDDTYLKLVLRPLPLFAQPAVFWSCLTQATLIGWTVLIGVVLAAIFMSAPLWFDEVQTGYLYTGPFIGAIVGFVVSGLLADWSARLLTKWNNGIFEPEFRIFLVIPQLLLGCAGIYGFGIAANDPYKYGWFWATFFFALVVAGMVIGAVSSGLYITDAYRDLSIEIFTCLLIFKNMLSFALTWKAYGWIEHGGIDTTFYWLGSVQVFVCLLSIPMYIFGKRNRSFWYRHDLMKMVHLK